VSLANANQNITMLPYLLAAEIALFASVEESSFPSEALGKNVPYCLWLPEKPPAGGERFPLLLVLHGRGRDQRSLVSRDEFLSAMKTHSIALAFPRGDDGWWVDSPVLPASRYQSMLLEFLDHLEARHSVGGSPSKRSVTGWSMGGFGAVRFALDHPELVGSLSSMIGLVDFPGGEGYKVPERVFGDEPSAWIAYRPTETPLALKKFPLLLVTSTDGFEAPQNRRLHQILLRESIPHRYEEMEGAHKLELVETMWPKILDFHEANFAEGARAEK